MFDIHCHLMFGVDDGADTVDETVRMLTVAAEAGTKGIVATPHANIPNSFRNYWNTTLYSELCGIRQLVKENNIPIEVYSGQEIFCTSDVVKLIAEKKLITINNSLYPLVEFDFAEFGDTAFARLESIVASGLVPIVAHPERYYFVQEDEHALYKMRDLGCVIQMNKGSMTGAFGRGAAMVAEYMLENTLVDCIASDAHSPYSRTPDLEGVHEMIADDFDIDYADLLLETNPMNIICNKRIEFI